MAIKLGGLSWDVSINVSSATNALSQLDRQTRAYENRLRQTTSVFGGLGNQLGAFGTSLRDVENRIQGLGRALAGLESQASKIRPTVRVINQETNESGEAADEAAFSFGNAARALSAFAAALGAVKVARVLKDFTLLAARVESLGTVLRNVGANIGLNSNQLAGLEKSVRSLGITTRAARQSLSQLAQANIDLTEATKLTRIAQDAAVIAGIDSSEAFNRLVVAIQRNDVRLLRNLGIVINLNQVYQRFAQQANRSATSLSAFEKRQLVLNEVVRKGALIQGTYEASLQDSFKQLTSLRRLIEEASVAIGRQFEPVLAATVGTISDFLKEVVKTDSIIPRVVAAFGVLTVTTGILAGALGGLALAISAVSVVAAPVTIALTAIAVVLGGLVALFVDSKLATAQFRQELEASAEAARVNVQALTELEDKIQRLRDLARVEATPQGLNAEELAEVQVIVDELIQKFPQLGQGLARGLEGATPAQEAVAQLGAGVSGSLELAEDRLKSLEVQARSAGRELANTAREVSNVFLKVEKDRIELRKRVGSVDFDSSLFLNADLIREQGAAAFIAAEAEAIKGSERLQAVAKKALVAQQALIAQQTALATESSQAFFKTQQALTDQSSRAIELLTKLENERVRLFAGTSVKQFDLFVKNQDRIIKGDIATKEELLKQERDFSVAQRRILLDTASQNIAIIEAKKKSSLVTEEEGNKEIERINRETNNKLVALAENAAQKLQSATEGRLQILKAREQAIQNIVRALEEEEAQVREIQELTLFEANELTPNLIQQRKKFLEETRKLSGANEELVTSLEQAQDRFLALGGSRQELEALAGITEIPKFIAEGLETETRNIAARIINLNRGIAANNNKLSAQQALFAARFARERKQELDKIAKEEEDLQRKLLLLQEDGAEKARLATKKGVDARIDELEKASDRADDFIAKTRAALDASGTQGLGSVTVSLRQFEQQIGNVSNAAQLADLQNLFPQVVKQRVDEATEALKNAQQALRDFQDFGKAEAEQRDRREVEQRIQQLTAGGVRGFAFQAEIAKLQRRQRKRREAEERKLEEAVSKQQERRNRLVEAGKEGESRLAAAASERKSELSELGDLQARSLQLQKEETAEIQKQIEKLKEKRAVLEGATEGGLGGSPAAGGAARPPSEAARAGSAAGASKLGSAAAFAAIDPVGLAAQAARDKAFKELEKISNPEKQSRTPPPPQNERTNPLGETKGGSKTRLARTLAEARRARDERDLNRDAQLVDTVFKAFNDLLGEDSSVTVDAQTLVRRIRAGAGAGRRAMNNLKRGK